MTPFKGCDILLRVDLINELRKTGSHLLDSATNSQSIILQNGDPALIFQVRDQEVEIEIEGEKVKVPLCNPYLVLNSVTNDINDESRKEDYFALDERHRNLDWKNRTQNARLKHRSRRSSCNYFPIQVQWSKESWR